MKFFNTLTKQKEDLKPIKDGEVGIYSCGPTVYNYAHIGNMRSYVFADLLQRVLKTRAKVKWVMNITDVDDKTIRDSKEKFPELDPKEALQKFTREYEEAFFQDLAKLNIDKNDFAQNPRATEHIDQMQALIRTLLDKKIAYKSEGSIYFSIEEYQKAGYKYGVLIKLDLANLKKTERIQADEYDKENVQDFALWKAAKEGEPSWDFEVDGKNLLGHPGWHIECSAMSEKYLGIPFDIHTGGVDNAFPHHEDEIAQTCGASGKDIANIFMHGEFLLVDGKKMSKSLGNIYTIEDIIAKGFDPLALRYLYLSAHYRSKLNFTWKSLEAAQNALNNLRDFVLRSHELHGTEKTKVEYKDKFTEALENDLDTPVLLADINALITEVNKLGKNADGSEVLKIFKEIDEVLGLDLIKVSGAIPEELQKLAEERSEARRNKDFVKSDEIRQKIQDLGYEVEDTSSGPRLYQVN